MSLLNGSAAMAGDTEQGWVQSSQTDLSASDTRDATNHLTVDQKRKLLVTEACRLGSDIDQDPQDRQFLLRMTGCTVDQLASLYKDVRELVEANGSTKVCSSLGKAFPANAHEEVVLTGTVQINSVQPEMFEALAEGNADQTPYKKRNTVPWQYIVAQVPDDPDSAQKKNAMWWRQASKKYTGRSTRQQIGYEIMAPEPIFPVWFKPGEGYELERQPSNCLTTDYSVFPQCRTCTCRKGDECRFRGIRVMKRYSKKILEYGPSFMSDDKVNMTPYEAYCLVRRDLPDAPHPNEWYVLRSINDSLLQMMESEYAFATDPAHPSVLRNMVGSRQLCDRCLTSVFNGFWLCPVNGCEFCQSCYDEWQSSYSESGNTMSVPSVKQSGENMNYCRKVFLKRCCYYHIPQQFVRVRRLETEELAQACADARSYQIQFASLPPLPTQLPWPALENTEAYDYERPLVRVTAEQVTLADFQTLWRQGEALVVENLFSRLKLDWSPSYWSEYHGDELVMVLDCVTGAAYAQEVQLADFFREFDGLDDDLWTTTTPFPEEEEEEESVGATMDMSAISAFPPHADTVREQSTVPEPVFPSAIPAMTLMAQWLRSPNRPILKLKDWPPKADFKDKFPDHFDDFMQALPIPEYTHRDGQCNLVSRLPQCFIPPELGPKMYVAYGSNDDEGGRGTTNLHLDMADAINLMVYASSSPNARRKEPLPRAAAVWDIYHYDDLPKIRRFLRQHMEKQGMGYDDPIHDQSIYLDSTLRASLFSSEGVRGWRIYQNVGEAVFVPAGCAHQVCNYTSCIKVAMDFVSPENVSRCHHLTTEFRRLNLNHQRKQDLLQLKSILYYAWQDAQAVVDKKLPDWCFGPRPAKEPKPRPSIPSQRQTKPSPKSSLTPRDSPEKDTDDPPKKKRRGRRQVKVKKGSPTDSPVFTTLSQVPEEEIPVPVELREDLTTANITGT
ncbi:hypothetical protein IWQ62_001312 [Dispira parvispora]|uniref:JmjC domain-containing protein n=1 Tax=Dispira parvispora TaxID=1520584 RepID=A0A9W8AVB8_9FUNG|nr:hypothetical protein IWQ62_001312 [Dispira parvispora]